jgi:hypothetical protein
MAAGACTGRGRRIGLDTSLTPQADDAVGLHPRGIAIDRSAFIAAASGTQGQLQDPRQVMEEIHEVAHRATLGRLAEREVARRTHDAHALSEASAEVADPLRLGPFADDAHAGLRSRADSTFAIGRAKGDNPELHELLSNAVTVRAVDPFAAVDSEQQSAEQEKIQAIVDEFDRRRRA